MKKLLLKLLIVLMLLATISLFASCEMGDFQSVITTTETAAADHEEMNPEEETFPEDVTSSDDVTNPDGTSPGGTNSEGTTPEEANPDTPIETIPDITINGLDLGEDYNVQVSETEYKVILNKAWRTLGELRFEMPVELLSALASKDGSSLIFTTEDIVTEKTTVEFNLEMLEKLIRDAGTKKVVGFNYKPNATPHPMLANGSGAVAYEFWFDFATDDVITPVDNYAFGEGANIVITIPFAGVDPDDTNKKTFVYANGEEVTGLEYTTTSVSFIATHFSNFTIVNKYSLVVPEYILEVDNIDDIDRDKLPTHIIVDGVVNGWYEAGYTFGPFVEVSGLKDIVYSRSEVSGATFDAAIGKYIVIGPVTVQHYATVESTPEETTPEETTPEETTPEETTPEETTPEETTPEETTPEETTPEETTPEDVTTPIPHEHIEEPIEGIEPTCTETGLTEGKRCSICDEVLVAQETISALGHDEVIDEAIAPTCTEMGYTEGKHCSRCNQVFIKPTVIPPLNHTESEWKIEKEATEFENGTQYTECTVCGYVMNRMVIAAYHIHEFSDWLDVESSVCCAVAHKVRFCLTDGCDFQELDLAEGIDAVHPHEYVRAEETESTCSVQGIVYRIYCQNCNFIAFEELKPTEEHDVEKWFPLDDEEHSGTCNVCKAFVTKPHDYNKEDVLVEPTCILPGVSAGVCKTCGAADLTGVISPLGHEWGKCQASDDPLVHLRFCERCDAYIPELHTSKNWTIVKEATCYEAGLKIGTCTLCNKVFEEVIEEDHNWEFVSFEGGSSCEIGGTYTRRCQKCGEVQTTKLTEPSHDYQYSYTKIEPTCTEPGWAVKKCSRCGVERESYLFPLFHDYDYRIVTHPTCTSSGEKIGTCTRCGKQDRDLMLSLGHSYPMVGEVISVASCYTEGVVKYRCQRDGCSHVKVEVIPKIHAFDEGVVTISPTCTTEGELVCTCTTCGVILKRTLPTVHNNLTYYSRVAPTCTRDGRTGYWQCNDCDAYFSWVYSDSVYIRCDGRTYKFGSHRIHQYYAMSTPGVSIRKLGHCYSIWCCDYDETYHYFPCYHIGCDSLKKEEHSFSSWISQDENTHYHYCWKWDCGQVEYQEHTLEDAYEVRSEKVGGLNKYYICHYWYCTGCNYTTYGEKDQETGKIIPTEAIEVEELHEHDAYEVLLPVDATCTQDGLEVGLKCAVCSKILLEQEVIPALDHNFVDGVCTRCGFCSYSKGLEFALNDDGQSYSVVGIGTCTDIDLVIPDKYEGLPVTSIGNYAFLYCTSLTSVTIGDSVTSIDDSAFGWCEDLTSVTIGDSVTSIDDSAFAWCEDLTSVTIGDSVASIGGYAFFNCDALTSITIPDSVTSIGVGAFAGCSALTSIVVDKDNTTYQSINGNLYSKNGKTLIAYASGKKDTSFTILDSVTTIGDGAFTHCDGLTSITIPDSVTSIGYSAFRDCDALTSITIPDSVTSIGDFAFAYCTSLTSITIPDSVTSIGYSAFQSCSALTSITIPDSVTSIGYSAFQFCSALTSIVVDKDNTAYQSIDGNLYSKNGKTLIAYASGKKDTSFTIPDSVTSIGDYAFFGCPALTSITIPDSVTSIGNFAFRDCDALTSITMGDSVTNIGELAFFECSNLTSVTLGESVTTIDYYAFGYCKKITNITIPDSVTTIEMWAFGNCTNLTSVTFDGTVAQWGAIKKDSTWNISTGDYTIYCTDGEITKNGTVTYYEVASEGLEFTLNSDEVSYSVTGVGTCTDTDIVIPSTYNGLPVTTIGWWTFGYCNNITSITIPDSVTTIGNYAFYSCDNLTYNEYGNAYYLGNDANPYIYLIKAKSNDIESCVIHENTKFIGDFAFINCLITSVTIPDSVTAIGTQAFSYCPNITSITIPDSVIRISDGVFFCCDNLTNITIPNSVITIGENAFAYCPSLTSVTIPDSVTILCPKTFQCSTNLTSVTIGDSVTAIGEWTFQYCNNLTRVIIGDSVTTIGYYAFQYCNNLTSVTIPNSVTAINNEAFAYCTSLTSITFEGTIAQWNEIEKGISWNDQTGSYTIYCTDGTIAKDGTVTYY